MWRVLPFNSQLPYSASSILWWMQPYPVIHDGWCILYSHTPILSLMVSLIIVQAFSVELHHRGP